MSRANITGFDSLMKSLDHIEGGLSPEVKRRGQQLANKLAGVARAGAPVKEGRLRNSIHAFSEATGDELSGGAATEYPPAWYHEFGTGPVGEANNHPAAAELGIVHKGEGWTYWSDDVASERALESDGEENGFVYTEGVPARAFMYNAMKSMEDEIMDELGAAVTEVLNE